METNIEIIKRKIREAGGSKNYTLADVLLAIGKNKLDLAINCDGGFLVFVYPDKWEYKTDWNLKETLEGQEESTIDFIADLIT